MLAAGMMLAMLCAFYGVPVGGALLWHRLGEARHLRLAREGWQAFAAALGLVGGERKLASGAWELSFAGWVDGQPVWIRLETANPTQGTTEVHVSLHPPFDGCFEVPVASALDPRVNQQIGPEPWRTHQVLAHPHVQAALRRLPFAAARVGDGGVVLRYAMFVADPRGLKNHVEAALATVAAIDAVRRSVPAPPALTATLAAWSAVARDLGLSVGTAPVALFGNLLGVEVHAYVRRMGQVQFCAEARFTRTLGGAFALLPTAVGARIRHVDDAPPDPRGEDFELGDPEFDQAFIVRSSSPERLARVLPPSLREALLRQHERMPLVVNERMIRIDAESLPDPGELGGVLRRLAELAFEIEASVHGGGATPYR